MVAEEKSHWHGSQNWPESGCKDRSQFQYSLSWGLSQLTYHLFPICKMGMYAVLFLRLWWDNSYRLLCYTFHIVNICCGKHRKATILFRKANQSTISLTGMLILVQHFLSNISFAYHGEPVRCMSQCYYFLPKSGAQWKSGSEFLFLIPNPVVLNWGSFASTRNIRHIWGQQMGSINI